jgi:hypothetical protein
MAASLTFLNRLGDDSLHGVALAVDRSLRLSNGAVRNAARSVTSDRANARARAEAAMALDVLASVRHVELRGA